jgi:cytochrome P450
MGATNEAASAGGVTDAGGRDHQADRLRCPVVHGAPFDPGADDQVLDPHPWLKLARTDSPVFRMADEDAWCVTRYDDVLEVLKDTETFSSKRVVEPRHLSGLEEKLPEGHPLASALVNTDPPEHTRLRKLAQKAFTPRMVASYEPRTKEIAEDLVDGFIDSGRTDVIQNLTRALTSQTITVLLGAPLEKAEDFAQWSDNIMTSLVDAPPLSAEREAELVDEVVEFNGWLIDFIEDRRSNPRDDYVSGLVHAQSDDGRPVLSTHEVTRILANVLSAGLDTTSSLIAVSLEHLLSERGRWDRLIADPTLIPQTVEEVLRFDTPIRLIRRDVLADTEVGGVAIPAGSVLYLSYSSAQRDEKVFAHPDTFDIDRDDLNQHFAFGRWKHFCLGAQLARMEAKVALEVLTRRIPSLRIPPGAELEALNSRMGLIATSYELEWDLDGSPALKAG